MKPRKILHRSEARYAGSLSSSSVVSSMGSSLRRHFSIRFTSSTHLPNWVAWYPEVIMQSSIFCRSSGPSKSYPRTVGVPSGISTDLSKTASSAPSGTALRSFRIVLILCFSSR